MLTIMLGPKFKNMHLITSYASCENAILYIKTNMVSVCLSVCVDKNWAMPGRFFQSLPVPCGDKQGKAGVGQGRAARAAAAGGRVRCHFY
jgi:hypothetical protein